MKHSIKVSLQKNKSESKPIRLRVSFSSIRVDLSTGISYEEKNWKNDRPKPNTRNANNQTAIEVNQIINKQIEFIDNWFIRCDLDNLTASPERLKNDFSDFVKGKKNEASTLLVSSFFDEYLTEISKNVAYKTLESAKSCLGKLNEYKPQLTIKNVPENLLNDIAYYMQANQMYNTSIINYVQGIQKFFNWLHDKKGFPISLREREYIKVMKDDARSYLEHDELVALYGFSSDQPKLQQARDMFIFCAFTGLRYCDMRKLKKIEVYGNQIHTTMLKTGKHVVIDLNRFSREIYDKYMHENEFSETLFPKNNLATYNRKLTEIFRRLNFNRPILQEYYQGNQLIKCEVPKYTILSSHSARRTFVVECLQRNIPPIVIIRWTGHKDLTALGPYIAIVDAQRKSEMNKFDNLDF